MGAGSYCNNSVRRMPLIFLTSQSMFSTSRWAIALFFLAPAMMAVNYVLGRLAFGLVAPHMLALLRWALAGVILLVFAWPELYAKRSQLRRHAVHCLVLGALGMWICGAWVYIGARTTSANNIALLYAMSPAFIALASMVWLRERLAGVQWLGLALAFAGLLHVIIAGQWGALAAVTLNIGDAWILAAVLSWAAYSILLKRWPSDLSPLARLVLIIFGGVMVLLPLARICGQPALEPHRLGLADRSLGTGGGGDPRRWLLSGLFHAAKKAGRNHCGAHAVPGAAVRRGVCLGGAGRTCAVAPRGGRGGDFAWNLPRVAQAGLAGLVRFCGPAGGCMTLLQRSSQTRQQNLCYFISSC
jgi:drug/metabolite transporter (DMT)-like permease